MNIPDRDDSAGAPDATAADPAGLTSLLILCCNALDCTRACLDSVCRHTRPPYELVLVDNGSSDDTPAYLDGLRGRPGPRRVEVLHNATNRGFAAGCNQALAQARGECVLFLNNDTLVTAGWLDGLLACLTSAADVGLVGPVTNLSEVPQQIPVDYTTPDGLEAFAARRRQECAGQVLEVEKLSGFCLLARRSVLARVGGFDESYGLGYYEDHDLAFRAQDAGYRLRVALDVFIHHVGGRTFAALGIDGRSQWFANLKRFRAKWGEERTAGYPRTEPDASEPGATAVSAVEAVPATADTAVAQRQPQTGSTTDARVIAWQGAFAAVHSLAHVNRELCRTFLARGHNLTLLPTDDRDPATPRLPVPAALAERLRQPAGRAAVHVRHSWPPDFTPPADGHWVLMQPWEFGSLPRAWVEPMSRLVDEVWVYSHYLRDCYVQSGVPAERVQVVPLGVDPACFQPHAAPLPLATRKRWKFLFVGGTIFRKGIDLLLDAYTRTFTAADDVCLVIKDLGAGSFYQGQTAGERIAALRATPGAPAIEYLDRTLTAEELAGLYTACDCLVLPYRGEGFGLPLAEAMACGLPVLVTGHGAALDFCTEERAFLLPARTVQLPEKRVGLLETVDYPWLAEPDPEALRALLRHVVEHPDEARAKGARARAYVAEHLTWERAADVVEQRLRELCGRPVRRFLQTAAALTVPAAAPARPHVSLTMIVKNEEHHLPVCLESAAGLFDETIVVDTGSTDRTKEIAARFGARVFDFPWVDSFAAARNEALRHATGTWAFWLDADDRLDHPSRQALGDLFARLPAENVAYTVKCICLPDPHHAGATVVDHVRLFRNHPELRWRYRVHEQILPAVRQFGGAVCFTEIAVHHVGYQDATVRGRKLERDLRLLRLDHAEHPTDPFILFNLGAVHHELGRSTEALPFLMDSLRRSCVTDSIVRKLYALVAQCHRQLNEPGAALVACKAGRTHYPDDAELLFQEGLLLRQLGEHDAARACFQRLLHSREGAHFASVDASLRGWKTRHNLAALCQEEGRTAEAEVLWRQTLAEQPDFGPAWVGLGDLLLEQGRWRELDEVLARLEAAPDNALEALVLRARGCMVRKEYPRARQLLDEAIGREPRNVWPRVLLSHALLQEGRDWDTAEQVLRDVLTLDPENVGARQNLTVLLNQNGRRRAALPA